MSNAKKPDRKPIYVYILIVVLAMLLINLFLFPAVRAQRYTEVDYSAFLDMVDEKKIAAAEIQDDVILFADKNNPPNYYKTAKVDDPDLVKELKASGAKFTKVTSADNPIESFLLGWVLPLVIFYGIGVFISRRLVSRMGEGFGGGNPMLSFGKSNAKVYVPSTTSIKFKDVAGEEEAKALLQELVKYLHDPKAYADIGAQCPKGALLVGPPGTGKTLLAKAVAGEANVPFFSIAGSEFVEMFVGMGASKVRDLFEQAAKNAPCIVFIDEIDTIGKKRDAGALSTNDEREQTLNQLLTEMDGFDGSKGVIILGATNRPEVLDPALLRPGRFDRRIPVELPDLQGRIDILKVHGKKVKLADNVDFEPIAKTAAGASGAELANIVNEAALRAVRMGRHVVTQEDLQESIEVVIAGYQKKSRVLSDKEKLIVAYHEIGHALVAAKQTDSAPVQKITIIPRTSGALGYTLQVDEGDRYLMSKDELLNKICTFTGGRCAEELIFHSITTGASNDIEQATKLARAMITQYGMDDDFGMVAMSTQTNQYLGGDMSLSCAPDTAKSIDDRVVAVVREQHDKALKILKDNEIKLHQLAKYLYEHETITGEEFMEILQAPVPSVTARSEDGKTEA
ncbi:ATP-dependent zinc metalloprotease FtsH [Chordicoccus furentiruminis]|uniref:ATP-dependent zinc metalloprotease FtsH n=1 Tax=Chordicoccus furentiruminis TaxID=2709410 RepID=UPI0023A8B06A|nr:ATP-dependent zinc metalloprotease FtsH [Chordicoccus furentiruminis]